LLLMQALLFAGAAYFRRANWLYADNFYYDSPAWNLASGHGFTLARSQADDPYLTDSYRARHPEADPERIPATTLPPGYGLFLAGLYTLAGHHFAVAVAANGALMFVTLLCLWRLLERRGWAVPAFITLALMAGFPSWAFWSAVIMSDMLHCALITLFAVLLFHKEVTPRRAVVSGVVLGLAALVRPYALLLPFALLAWYLVVDRIEAFAPRRLAVVALIAWSIVGCWTVRNYAAFGKLIPVTSMGLGKALWLASYPTPFMQDAGNTAEVRAAEARAEADGIVDWHRHRENQELTRIAVARIEAQPLRYVGGCLQRVVRLWISAVAEGVPRLIIYGFLVVQVLTLVGMLVGLWIARRAHDPVLAGAATIVLYYWLVFVPFGGEARSLLPARGFGMILAGVGLTALLRRIRQGARPPAPSS
jgi:4-amino-4-deoxy-L-arabinose transferase-like glycosyltransferase